MQGAPTRLVLASASERRRQLLRQLGQDPLCRPVDVDESADRDETPQALVERLAILKAESWQKIGDVRQGVSGDRVVVGADTVIDLDGQVLGKPRDREHAIHMLLQLADREHRVFSGVCVLRASAAGLERVGWRQSLTVCTQVRFGPLSQAEAEAYWHSGEPVDKAGAYAIQGIGAGFVAHLSGSYSNVVGLPLYETRALLHRAGLTAVDPM